MTFLMLAIRGIIAVCFGLLAFEYIVIGLARAIAFIQDHYATILIGVGGIIGVLVIWCVWDSHVEKEQEKENRKAMLNRRDEHHR